MERPLRLVIVGHGAKPIPPDGHGAVENIIWQLDLRMNALGHRTKIVNVRRRYVLLEVIRAWRSMGGLDFVHSHAQYPVPALIVLGRLLGFRTVFTCHDWNTDIDSFDPGWRRLMERCAQAPYLLNLTERSLKMMDRLGARGIQRVLRNGTEVGRFEFDLEAEEGKQAVCVGKVEPRKRQKELAATLAGSAVSCDYVGPDPDGDFEVLENGTYRGPMTRDELYKELTHYRAHVLVSTSEGQPLVVTEALAAGLSVVVTQEAAENIDLERPFVFVVGSLDEVPSVLERAVSENATHRQAIRKYAESTFDYDVIAQEYAQTLMEWRGGAR